MEDYWNQIEAYYQGQLSPEEKSNFEHKMKTDPALAQEVELYKDIEGGLRLNSNKVLKNQLDQIHDRVLEKPASPKVRRLNISRVAMIAASIALLLMAGYFLLLPSNSNTDQIFAQNFSPFEWTVDTRGGNENTLSEIQALYSEADYSAFLEQAQAQNLNPEENPALALALGNAAIATNDLSKAFEYLEIAQKNTLFEAEAKWYMGLAAIKAGDLATAKNTLESLANRKDSYFANKAQQLLNNL